AASLPITDRRVPSPSAKNTTTARSVAFDILSNVLRLSRPAPVVHPERPLPPMRRHTIEAGFYYRELRLCADLLEVEFDECRRLVVRIDLGVNAVRNPAEAEIPLRIDPLHGAEHGIALRHLDLRRRETEALLILDDRGLVEIATERAGHRLACHERAVQLDAEPAPELPRIGDCLPDARHRRAQGDSLLDLVVFAHVHLHCVWRHKCNLMVAVSHG